MGIIDSIYNGDLFPCEQTNEYKAEINSAHRSVCDAENKLLEQHPECKELIDGLASANTHLMSVSDCGEYVKGFRHGALLMLDILSGSGIQDR
ncbi:MAG: hypothetical protein IK093_01675 [Ruminiclostridium sp.]|nr:hypothetical protein [Ruminiclostridium sp.]